MGQSGVPGLAARGIRCVSLLAFVVLDHLKYTNSWGGATKVRCLEDSKVNLVISCNSKFGKKHGILARIKPYTWFRLGNKVSLSEPKCEEYQRTCLG